MGDRMANKGHGNHFKSSKKRVVGGCGVYAETPKERRETRPQWARRTEAGLSKYKIPAWQEFKVCQEARNGQHEGKWYRLERD